MTEAERFHRMADWAERKANENAASDKPWALRNVRLYQGLMSKYLGRALDAERREP